MLRGGPPGVPDPGYFVELTVYLYPQRRSRLSCEEVFGPVLCLIPAVDEQEALEIANESKFGLCASVFTRDLYSALDSHGDCEPGWFTSMAKRWRGVAVPFAA